MAGEPPRVQGSTAPRRVVGYLAVLALFAIASVASGGLLHLADDASGARSLAPAATASFVLPGQADRGLRPGRSVSVQLVHVAPSASIRATCGPDRVAGRRRQLVGSEQAVFRVPSACSGRWLVIRVPAIRQPLRAWVR